MLQGIAKEILLSVPLALWVLFVIKVLTKRLFNYMLSKGYPKEVAVYFNRKVIHILAGGVALLIPFVYSEPLVPVALSLLLTTLIFLSKRRGKLMDWFQTTTNNYEVHFTVMTAIMIWLGYSLGNPWYGILPVAFMAFGDGVTGIIRNVVYKRRSKAWIGNLGMALVNALIGNVMGLPGIVAGIIASVVERFELLDGKIDDNVTVPIASFLTLVILKNLLQ